jgi:4,5-DOPA dioxygenase extradiol
MIRRKFIKLFSVTTITGTFMALNKLSNLKGQSDNIEKMPVLFVGHGSPMNAIEENEFVAGWRDIGKTLPKPNAILCISAHWETSGTFVTAMENPKTIHDFGGFPARLYEVVYPAPGDPGLAEATSSLIKRTKVGLDYKWGLDHGCWSVVRHLYPGADIPVIQMSMDYHQVPQFHYDLGKELSSLRKKGVLIIGSGNIVHNLGLVAWDKLDKPGFGYDWAIQANEKIKKFILSDNHISLIDYKSQGKEFDLAIPTPDHFVPLLYTLALKEKNETITVFNDKAVAGSLTMTSFRIGEVL